MTFSPDTGPILYYENGDIYQLDKELSQVDSTSVSNGEVYGGIDVRPDGTFYVANGGTIVKMDSNGNQVWETANFTSDFIDDILYEPFNGNVYAVGGVEVIAFDDSDGSTLWESFSIGNPNSLTFAEEYNHVVAGGKKGEKDGSIVALDANTGNVKWAQSPSWQIDSVVSYYNESNNRTEYLAVFQGYKRVYGFYVDSGAFNYSFFGDAIDVPPSSGSYPSSGYHDGEFYYTSFRDAVYKYRLDDGSQVFEAYPGNTPQRGTDFSPNPDGRLYASFREDGIHEIDSNDGTTITSTSFGQYEAGSIAYPRYETFQSAWEGPTVEEVTAAQTSVGATMNTASAAVPITINAVQFNANASTNDTGTTFKQEAIVTSVKTVATVESGSVSMSQPATTVSTAATMKTGVTAFNGPITATQVTSVATADGGSLTLLSEPATQFGAVVDSNTGSLSSYNLSALSASVGASMNAIDTEATFFIKADVTPVSASQNDATLTLPTVDAIQPTTIGTTLSPELDYKNEIDAVLTSVSATENSTETYFTVEYDESQLQVGVTPNETVVADIIFINATHPPVSVEMNTMIVPILRATGFGDETSVTLNKSKNSVE